MASVALVGAMINGAYGAHLLVEFADARIDPGLREVVISGIAMEFAWAVLLLWAVLHPRRGRFLLPITSGALLVGNLLHSYAMIHFDGAGLGDAMRNLAVGSGTAALFALAYFLSGPSSARLGTFKAM